MTHNHKFPFQAATLGDKVYICGGKDRTWNPFGPNDPRNVTNTCFTTSRTTQGKWQPAESMNVARFGHTLTRVGHRLVATGGGGVPDLGREQYGGTQLDSIEIFQPDMGWQVSKLRLIRPDTWHCALGIDNSRLIILSGTGNNNETEVTMYNIDSGAVESFAPPPGTGRGPHFCTSDEDSVYIAEWLAHSQYKIHHFVPKLQNWIPGIPRLNETKVEGMAIINGHLTVFGRLQVSVLRDNQWITAKKQPMGQLNGGAVIVFPRRV